MSLSLDHVVILVYDLERAQADYRELGFTVVEGGRHADGLSHNALVSFADGSYLELIAFLEAPPDNHPFRREHGLEGLVTYALLPTSIESTVRGARERGLHLEGPKRGGRSRPDGVRIEWQTAWPHSHDLPFLCADVTSRDLRVPYGHAHRHTNGVEGIAGVTVLVRDLGESKERHVALLGSESLPHGPYNREDTASFAIGECILTLIAPTEGPMLEHLERRGEGPYALALLAGEGQNAETLDAGLAHGVEIEIVPQGSDLIGSLL
jgi:catechol 2,3-dioxygenase-like lactoylglutathione lyase family enzyme